VSEKNQLRQHIKGDICIHMKQPETQEQAIYTRGVTGSIPVSPTISFPPFLGKIERYPRMLVSLCLGFRLSGDGFGVTSS
jgi:hypothetical protein